MKVIVAGGRNFNDYNFVEKHLNKILINYESFNLEIVSGVCRGVDLLGTTYANNNGIKIKEFPADWDRYGKRAGPVRNEQMAKYADALVAFWDGYSKGTKSMIELAKLHGLKIRIINIRHT